MAETEAYAPHETRMLALEMAVSLINGDKQKIEYTAEDAIATAKKFEAYLTEKPVPGFVAKKSDEF